MQCAFAHALFERRLARSLLFLFQPRLELALAFFETLDRGQRLAANALALCLLTRALGFLGRGLLGGGRGAQLSLALLVALGLLARELLLLTLQFGAALLLGELALQTNLGLQRRKTPSRTLGKQSSKYQK